MRYLAIAAICSLGLGLSACNTANLPFAAINTGLATTIGAAGAASPSAAKALTRVNTTISNASTKVGIYLPLLQGVVAADCIVISLNKTGAKACNAASAVINAYNAGAAPTDSVSLAQFFERAITSLASAGVI